MFLPLTATLIFLCAVFCPVAGLHAEPIRVRHVEGVSHGFLVVHNTAGQAIAYGEMSQDTKRGVVTSRLVFHFKDGSLYQDTTAFTQRGVFRVLRDHLIEKGPSFKQPMETWLNARTGEFKAITLDKGKDSVVSKKIKLPNDLANGITYVVAKNIDPEAPSTTVSLLVGTPKPRIVKMKFTRSGERGFAIGDLHRTALHYVIKFDLGGVTGVVAPIIGKQPADMDIWIAASAVPTFLMSRGEFFEGGPIWTITLTTPRW